MMNCRERVEMSEKECQNDGRHLATSSRGSLVQTSDNCTASAVIPYSIHDAVVSGIRKHVVDIHDETIRTQVCDFCNALDSELTEFRSEVDSGSVYVDVREDEAYFEWIFDDFRFGFSFHHDMLDSYWFLVAKDRAESSIRFKGDFNAGFAGPIRYVLDYIRDNA